MALYSMKSRCKNRYFIKSAMKYEACAWFHSGELCLNCIAIYMLHAKIIFLDFHLFNLTGWATLPQPNPVWP